METKSFIQRIRFWYILMEI